MSLSRSQRAIDLLPRFLPLVQKTIDLLSDACIYIRLEGIRPTSFRSTFSHVLSGSIKQLDLVGDFDKARMLRSWWERWKFSADPRLDGLSTLRLQTRRYLEGATYEIGFHAEMGFGILKPLASANPLTPGSIPSTQPDIQGYDQAFEVEAFKAFCLLKATNRIEHSVVLRGITLEEVEPLGMSLLYPSLLIIENDPSSIAIL